MSQHHNQPGFTDQSLIRNFCIIAHIDHGKSTVADRILQLSGIVPEREMRDRFLDRMDIEQERGITIKSQAVRVPWTFDGVEYTLGMIDTPGHVDFTYEVSRALAACEGAVLLVDATQGIEAQTLSNLYMAIDHDLTIIPVLNKIDLPSAEPERVIEEIEDVIGLEAHDAPLISAKNGINIEDVMEAIVHKLPPPSGSPDKPLKCLIFDSFYDNYRGVVVFFRILDGSVRKGMRIRLMSTGAEYDVVETGYFGAGQLIPCDELETGMVGYLTASIKNVKDTRVGDTITDAARPCAEALPGFKTVQSMVFCGMYPADGAKYPDLRDALERLQLNDASLTYEPETSVALGFGFRCGFLGLLHMDIIQERLEREYGVNLITTAPTVIYEVKLTSGEVINVDSPARLPPVSNIEEIREPIARCNILVPDAYVGNVIQLCIDKRGVQKSMLYHGRQVEITYEIPLAEVVLDFFDRLKSTSRGYASLDYGFDRFEKADMVRMDILINGERVDALAVITHRSEAQSRGRALVTKMKELIPRQMFEVAIQAAIGSQIIARSTVKALRKDVLAKCYGGDITRKQKLLNKQKAGKKRMKAIGKVDVPQDAFLAVLHVGTDEK